MKRTPMPGRRTPMRRTGLVPDLSPSGVLRSGKPKRTKPLPKVSERQKRINAARRPAVAALLGEQPWCQARLAGCQGRSVDAHELLRRSQGGDPTAPDLALCRSCHSWVTEHPRRAVALGLARGSWTRGETA